MKLPAQGSSTSGERLAKQHCSGCHRFPEPGLLDAETWAKRVLPNMGWRLGIRAAGEDPFAGMDAEEAGLVRQLAVYPDRPAIGKGAWDSILRYFAANAPAHPETKKQLPVTVILSSGFRATPVSFGERTVPRTTLLAFDTLERKLYIGDADGELLALDGALRTSGYWKLSGPPSHMSFQVNQAPRVLTVGSIAPTEKRNGAMFPLVAEGSAGKPSPPVVGLARPVHLETADLDGDGGRDEVLCEFGNHTGRLVCLRDGDPAKAVVLSPLPGARRTVIRDMDGDGRKDIIALMAQAWEKVLLFTNKGDGRFEETTLLAFDPLHGGSHLETADFNGDNHPDLLVSNGDNWDLSPIRKSFHGIRVYLNDGGNRFSEAVHLPLYGAGKAMAADFDADGDLDIAAISFYDDPQDPSDGFRYYENTGGMSFVAATVPAAAAGKWLTMEIGDLDGDGDKDITLGSYFHNAAEVAKLSAKGITEFPQALILWNELNR